MYFKFYAKKILLVHKKLKFYLEIETFEKRIETELKLRLTREP